MATRVRQCVECPKCRTRYLLSGSPYRNGSFLIPLVKGLADEWTLYCSCRTPHVPSRWSWSELRRYAISPQAYDRGYGSAEETIAMNPVGPDNFATDNKVPLSPQAAMGDLKTIPGSRLVRKSADSR